MEPPAGETAYQAAVAGLVAVVAGLLGIIRSLLKRRNGRTRPEDLVGQELLRVDMRSLEHRIEEIERLVAKIEANLTR